MRHALAFALLSLAACGSGQNLANAKVDSNQIERLSRPKEEPQVDPQISARPQPLTGADLRGAGMTDPPRCDFTAGGHRLFAAQGGDALARINGTLSHFDQPSPAGPTGTFVTDRELSISIGRTDEIDPGGTGDERWPARLTATNRRTRAQVELTGTWRCGAT
ncbi:MAG TPA: hypothetical protein VEC11_11215 [Allosphingosinicella sp.]|nr:hypothetical protein [Allosphingosinicella sp.]